MADTTEKSMNASEMIKKNAEAKTKIRYNDRVSVRVITDTKHLKKGDILNPHPVMAEQMVKDKLVELVK